MPRAVQEIVVYKGAIMATAANVIKFKNHVWMLLDTVFYDPIPKAVSGRTTPRLIRRGVPRQKWKLSSPVNVRGVT